MTKILALVTDAFGGRGGIAQYNRDFLTALAADSTIVVLPRQAPDAVRCPDSIEQVPPRRGRVSYAAAAVALALLQPIDVVFCGHLYMAPLAWLVARMKRAKLVVQLHGIEAWSRPTGLRRTAVDAADLVLCVSRYTRACVASWVALPPERILVVPNTVGEAFTPGDGAAMRDELGLVGKKILLTVGRLDSRERYKGHDCVIAAIPELVAAGHDVAYVVVGEGDDRTRLAALARSTGVWDRLHLLGGLEPARLIEAYRMADLFVMPSTGEGFGIAFLEAMATGTPALGLAACGAVDALADGELGIAVMQGELGSAIADLLRWSRPDSFTLSQRVKERFGRAAFRARVVLAFHRLATGAAESAL